jgi:hypothetical protein
MTPACSGWQQQSAPPSCELDGMRERSRDGDAVDSHLPEELWFSRRISRLPWSDAARQPTRLPVLVHHHQLAPPAAAYVRDDGTSHRHLSIIDRVTRIHSAREWITRSSSAPIHPRWRRCSCRYIREYAPPRALPSGWLDTNHRPGDPFASPHSPRTSKPAGGKILPKLTKRTGTTLVVPGATVQLPT